MLNFSDYTLQTVVLGAALVGIVSGMLGSFALLRKQSLLGDAISHAALPGVAIAFMITLTKNPFFLLLGALASGWIGTLIVLFITQTTKVKEDAALGIVLSVFFGIGIVLLTIIQQYPTASQAGLSTFLFGNASTLLRSDLTVMALLGGVSLFLLLLLWKEFKLLTFDREYAASLGFPIKFLDVTLMTLIVIAIVVGLQTVGVVLMSAMLVAPAAAARQWTQKLSVMVILAALFGAFAGITGAVLSSTISHLPTGPTIVVVISSVVLVSLFFAPGRGFVWEWSQHRKHQKQIQLHLVLQQMYLLSQSHKNPLHPHELSSLRAVYHGELPMTLRLLSERGFVCQKKEKMEKKEQTEWKQERWALTSKGFHVAKKICEKGFVGLDELGVVNDQLTV